MRFDVVTIFPAMFGPVFEHGVVGRGIERGLIQLHAHDLRDYTHDRHRQVDDMPFGGGPGMVIKPEPVFEAVESIRADNAGPVVLLEPWGEPLDQDLAAQLAAEPGLIIVCGRYEGIDDRVRSGLASREISIGDYVLSGGEIPAMVLIDAVARLVPGVVGDPASLAQDSFSDEPAGWPQFTRPADYRGLMVPDVLLSGDHARINQWRRRKAAERSTVHTKELKKT
ncbi:MAG TPA: tRNA (guanosine(37)-N1)-methyltransferase TrmD [Candidatus Dormibacteraeota bacterium]|jgi:tRNA (guanine37-N1)-methyltransferase|nr:tRNA (guanosine(37)-N1)-methyltransferase TrmD [Candidatus Dormibacteraeota bacterium]